jgi:hypothetical protein
MGQALATMVITALSGTGVSIESMPVSNGPTCQKEMVRYIEKMPGASVDQRGEDFVQGSVSIGGRTITLYVKCQDRE